MKTVYIIAIAVGCSVVAVFGVFGVFIAWEELEYQMALAEWDKMQESVVIEYNREIRVHCASFVNYASALQCEENARKNFGIDLLDDEYRAKLQSGISQEASDELYQTLERVARDNALLEFAACWFELHRTHQYHFDRYLNEPEFKEQFDNKFPDLTFAEAVDFAESKNSLHPSSSNAEVYHGMGCR